MTFALDHVHEITYAPDSGINTPEAVIMAQVAANIRRGLPQAQPYDPNGTTVLLVCGGPSLMETKQELRDEIAKGGKVMAVNGAYNWCLDNDIRLSGMVMLDAREFNARFIERDVPGCRYLLASQCHPKAFELCQDRDVTIWHACSAGEPEVELLKKYYWGRTYPVTLGTTVAIRAISVLRMLGFTKFICFGLDSCWLKDEHHSYVQAENNRDGRLKVWLHAKNGEAIAFECAPWHCKQFEDFLKLVKERGDLFQLDVRGQGLIATAIKLGSDQLRGERNAEN